MNQPTSGELIDDGFYCTPASHVQPLSPEVLTHWGLLASPFSPSMPLHQPVSPAEFHFRSAGHASTLSWLQHLVNRPAGLGVLTTSSGSGTTSFLRQLCGSSGLGDTAIETTATQWNNQSIEQITSGIRPVATSIEAPHHVRSLWIVQAPPPSRLRPAPNRIALMAGWYAAHRHTLNNLSIVIVIRRTTSIAQYIRSESCPRSHHLNRFANHELRRCVTSALHHAGGARPVFTVSAVTRLAETAEGSIRRLGTLVHAALLHGHVAGLRQIACSDLTARLDQQQPIVSQARAA